MIDLYINSVAKRVKPVLAIPEKPVCLSPCLTAVASELVTVLILTNYYGGLVLAALLEEGQQAAAILVHTEHLLPVVVAHVRRKLRAQVTYLQITEDGRGVRHLRHVLDHVRVD